MQERCLTFNLYMVWLYRLLIPVGRRGYLNRSNDFYLPQLRLEEGGGGSAPCASTLLSLQSSLYTVKKVSDFPVPCGYVTIIKISPARKSLVSDIPLPFFTVQTDANHVHILLKVRSKLCLRRKSNVSSYCTIQTVQRRCICSFSVVILIKNNFLRFQSAWSTPGLPYVS